MSLVNSKVPLVISSFRLRNKDKIIKSILVVILALFLTSFFLSFSREFEFLKNKLLPTNIRKYVNKYTVGIGSILVIGISILLSILCI